MAAKSVIGFYTKQNLDVLIELPQGCSNKNSQCTCWCKITKLGLQTSHLPKQTFTIFFRKCHPSFTLCANKHKYLFIKIGIIYHTCDVVGGGGWFEHLIC